LEGERVLSAVQQVAAPDATPRDFTADVPLAGTAAGDASRLASGVYFVRVRITGGGDGGRSTARLVILK
jgi:hypothetical protein